MFLILYALNIENLVVIINVFFFKSQPKSERKLSIDILNRTGFKNPRMSTVGDRRRCRLKNVINPGTALQVAEGKRIH